MAKTMGLRRMLRNLENCLRLIKNSKTSGTFTESLRLKTCKTLFTNIYMRFRGLS